LKYQGDLSLGEFLARPLLHCLEEVNWAVDLVVPVPLSAARLAERGYNQAALLARPLALGSGLSFRPQALLRCRETRSQVGLSGKQRRENVAGAFLGNPQIVLGKKTLIVDDVTTSGATLEACAQALRTAGALEVVALTLARAV
jgi:ComF family protein